MNPMYIPFFLLAEAPPPVIERAHMNYPRFGREKHAKEAPLPRIPHRKTGSQIMAEMEVERARMNEIRPGPRGAGRSSRRSRACKLLCKTGYSCICFSPPR